MNEEKNTVKYLQQINFPHQELQEKLVIKALGRLTPDLNILQTSKSRSQSYRRKFNTKMYNQHDWLTGCAEGNALFCFPCLLFGGEFSWTQIGITDLKHLSCKIKRHECDIEHLKNVYELAILGTVNIKTRSSEAYSQEINKHNVIVKKNRDILPKLIDCIVFCGKFELPMQVHDETEYATNQDFFKELLEYSGKLDDSLKNYFINSSVFKGSSKNIQSELLECILCVCREEICNEIKRTKYLAIMVNDTSDISEHAQQAIVFRYELTGKVYERFWGFFNPKSQDTKDLAECIYEQLDIVLNGEYNKLIAQTYNDAVVTSGKQEGVQSIIKKKYENAHFIHCYAHQLNKIIEKAASQNLQVRIFFSSLALIPAYFSNSPTHLAILEGISKQISQRLNTLWNFNCRVLNTIFENKNILIQCFESLQNSNNLDTIQGAANLLRTLNDENFNFWLKFFYDIMPHVDILCCKIQNHSASSFSIYEAIKEFNANIENKKNNLPLIDKQEYLLIEKKKYFEQYNNTAAKEVCDYILCEVKERFHFTKHLSAIKLFSPFICQVNLFKFSCVELQEIADAYPYLDKERLYTELRVLYERSEFRNMRSYRKFYDILYNTSIYNSFTEVFKLLQIIITTPMMTTEPERRFPTYKRLKRFLENSTGQSRLSALAMLSIQNNMITNISNFNNKVIDKFVNQRKGRMEFNYK